MGRYFDDLHTQKESQWGDAPCSVGDTAEIAALRERRDPDGVLALGDALSRQLRYREAAEVFGRYIALRPGDFAGYRRRAARELALLRVEEAREDFLRARELGENPVEIAYRLGICAYLAEDYAQACAQFEQCWPQCGEELGIGAMYWHALASIRRGVPSALLGEYRERMQVGHHTAYEKAVRVLTGADSCEALLRRLERETDGLEYVIALYGVCVLLQGEGRKAEYARWSRSLLERDEFWPCLAYLAAWNDSRRESA